MRMGEVDWAAVAPQVYLLLERCEAGREKLEDIDIDELEQIKQHLKAFGKLGFRDIAFLHMIAAKLED